MAYDTIAQQKTNISQGAGNSQQRWLGSIELFGGALMMITENTVHYTICLFYKDKRINAHRVDLLRNAFLVTIDILLNIFFSNLITG